jgi:hypothetical protein
LELDALTPFLTLRAADEKNREGSTISLRVDLAEDLQQWLRAKRSADVTSYAVKRNNPLTMPVNGLQKGWLMGLEPTTSRSTIAADTILTVNQQGLTSTSALVCTSVCTSYVESNNANRVDADPVTALAAALLALSPADRERLAALLAGRTA